MVKTMKKSIKFKPETDGEPKEKKVHRPTPKITASKVKLEVADFDDFTKAIKKELTVYLVNPKKGTSIRGKLISWHDRDEGKESAIFRQLFKKKFVKVTLGDIYIENERT